MKRRPAVLFKILCVVGVFFFFGFYFFHQAGSYLAGPQVEISFPENGDILTDSFVAVKGRVLNVSELQINSRSVLVNDSGNFESGLLLARGYNIIGISAKDKFGRVANKKLEVVYR